MSEEIMTAAADLTTMIGLRAENDSLRQRLVQAEAELAKAETARKAWTELGAKAQADAAALRETLEYRHNCENCGGKGSYFTDVNGEAESEVCDCWIRADHVLYHEEHGIGAPLLAELEAARKVLEAAREWREAVEILNGVYAAEQALIGALVAYDAAQRPKETT